MKKKQQIQNDHHFDAMQNQVNTILLIVKRLEFYKHASKSSVQHTLSANTIDYKQCVEIVTVSILDEFSVLEKVFYFAFSFSVIFFFLKMNFPSTSRAAFIFSTHHVCTENIEVSRTE